MHISVLIRAISYHHSHVATLEANQTSRKRPWSSWHFCHNTWSMRRRMSSMSTPSTQHSAWLGDEAIAQEVFLAWTYLWHYLISFRWLYSLVLTVDANFCLKNKDKNFRDDHPLGDGFGHWVSAEPYRVYLWEYGHQAEVYEYNYSHL